MGIVTKNSRIAPGEEARDVPLGGRGQQPFTDIPMEELPSDPKSPEVERRIEGDYGVSSGELVSPGTGRSDYALRAPDVAGRPDSGDQDPRMGTRRRAGAGPMIAIDLDGTILDEEDVSPADGEFGAPLPGAVEALGALKDLGWTIVIWTARLAFAPDDATRDLWVEDIAEYLGELRIPFDEIAIEKPPADVFVDNKQVIQFNGDWEEVVNVVTQQYVERPDAGVSDDAAIVGTAGGFGLPDARYERGPDNQSIVRHNDKAYYED